MKLFNPPLSKQKFTALAVAALAGFGVAQGQYTGIGTTAPDATLHVVRDGLIATDYAAADEVLGIEGIKDLLVAEEADYSEVLVYDSNTGLFRREAIADLLDNNGEWVYDAGANTLTPRRANADLAGGISFGDAGNAVPFTVFGATNITGATNVTGTFGATETSTFGADVIVTTTLDIGTVNQVVAADIIGTDEVLIQEAGTDEVRYVTVTDLISNASYWDFDGTTLTPADAALAGDFEITDGDVDINAQLDVTGVTNITGATTITGPTSIVGNTDVTGDVDISGTLDIGTVTDIDTDLSDQDRVLIQDEPGSRVQYVTVEDLVQGNAEWRDGGAANPWIFANQANDASEIVVVTDDGQFVVGATDGTAGSDISALTGNIDVGNSAQFSIGTIGAFVGDGTNISTTATGNYDIRANGPASLITARATAAGTLVTLNQNGLNIGAAVSANARDLYVEGTGGSDDIEFGNLVNVPDVTTSGTDVGTTPASVFERVLITDYSGVVRYIDADDLVAASGEWILNDLNGDNTFDANEQVYLRRNGIDGDGDDIFVDFSGNMVASIGRAFQFADANNQINAVGITASAAYTMDLNNSLTMDITNGMVVNTGDAQDVSFIETGTNATAWLHFDAADIAGDQGRVGIGTNAPLASLHVAGNIVASHTAQTSDRRFKRDIEDFTGALDVVKAMRGVSYNFRSEEFPNERFDDANHLGFIAQELQEILPNAVFEREDGFLTVDYSSVTPVLAEAVEELAKRVETLEAENAALRGNTTDQRVGAVSTKQLLELEARIADMDARLQEVAGRK